jgi:DNA-binding transcriptional LysR family regulator
MDRLQAMAIFVAVVDEGGFAPAARRLRVSPPVVTRAVAELETSTGVRLLQRTTRVVRVTEAGARYASDCRRILAEITEAEEAAAGIHGEPRGHLVVTAPALFGRMYVMPIVTEYLERYPDTDIACRFVDRIVHLDEEGIDAAVRIGELADSSMQAVRVGRVRRVVCASPRYLEVHGHPRTPQDLAGHCVVSAGGVTPISDWRFVHEGRPLSVRVTPRLVTSTVDSAIAAARSGFGLTRVLSYQVAEDIDAGVLEVLLADFEPPPVPIHVLHREGRQGARKVRAFLDLAVARLRSLRSLG